jgi:phosphatidylglycerol:prolipoprotein diacylglycerol transferase
MAYSVCVAIGIALAYVARRLVPRPAYPHAAALAAIACVGALSGALLCELPADWFGWAAGGAGEPIVQHGIGGRTVLGGILGGWLAVELAKPSLGIRVATGDGFAAPLAVALACGRVGCALTGCCPGRASTEGSWWRGIAIVAKDGVSRFPASVVESVFHGAAAVALLLLVRRGALAGRALAAYVAIYCVVRVALEEVRDNPAILGRWTYYQLLAVPLFALAAATFVRRATCPAAASATTSPTPAAAGSSARTSSSSAPSRG